MFGTNDFKSFGIGLNSNIANNSFVSFGNVLLILIKYNTKTINKKLSKDSPEVKISGSKLNNGRFGK